MHTHRPMHTDIADQCMHTVYIHTYTGQTDTHSALYTDQCMHTGQTGRHTHTVHCVCMHAHRPDRQTYTHSALYTDQCMHTGQTDIQSVVLRSANHETQHLVITVQQLSSLFHYNFRFMHRHLYKSKRSCPMYMSAQCCFHYLDKDLLHWHLKLIIFIPHQTQPTITISWLQLLPQLLLLVV